MKKILFVINTLGGAGAERALLELLTRFTPEKYEISLYILLGQGELIHQVPAYVRILNQEYSDGSVLSRGGKVLLNKRLLKRIFIRKAIFRDSPYLVRNLGKMLKKGKNHLITSTFEHHAVLHTCAALEKEGFEVTYLDVHENGIVVPEELEAAITDKTGLVTIMYANNEIGTIQPIPEIGEICKKHGVWFHTDAVQAVGNVPINVKEQNIDMLSLSGHKFHGPKGVGVLYIKKGIILPNLIDGGAQERGRRAGTENVASIVGLSVALENAINTMDEKNAKLRRMQDKLITELSKIDRSHLNGDRYHRLPGNVNFSFEGVEGESMLLMLDLKGVCASSGSACTSGSLDPSHVLLAIGLKHEVAHGSLRLSFSDVNDESDADYIIEVLPKIIDRLRAMSPLWDAIIHGRTIS